MNKTLTKALLSAAVLTSGIVGAGSVIAQAGNDAAAPAPVVATSEADGAVTPAGLQTTDEPAEDAATTDGSETAVDSDSEDDRDGRGCGNNEAIADTLGLTTDELHEARDAGSSIAEIAATQGVNVDDIVQAIVEDKAERLEEKIAAGDLTADEAAERLADAEERAIEKVNGES